MPWARRDESWWVLSDERLRYLLWRAHHGDDVPTLMVELYANSETDKAE